MTELVLIIGDFFIPQRTTELPKELKQVLQTAKISKILCTGNLGTEEVFNWLKKVSNNLSCVKGVTDEHFNFPEQLVVKIGEFKLGLVNGYQLSLWNDLEQLAIKRGELGADILITGNSHKNKVWNYEGQYLINVGSATGSCLGNESNTSFVLLLIQNDICNVYSYEFNPQNKSFEITKTELNKLVNE